MIIAIWVVVASSFVISGLYLAYDILAFKKRYSKSWQRIRSQVPFSYKYALLQYLEGLLVVLPLLWVLFTIYGFVEFIKNY